MPALIFLGFSLNTEYWRVFYLALLGGTLGVLFMIPLRRQLIVKEHGNLTFPEGTACADVLIAGERGGSFAGRVFWGLGLGGVYTFCMNTLGLWPKQPDYQPKWLPGASMRCTITSEYLGVGYIIGPRVAGTLFAGGVISWLVMMPAIRFFGSLAPGAALYPSTIPIPQMNPDQLWGNLHSADGRGSGGGFGADYSDQDDADDCFGAERGNERCAREAGGDARGEPDGARSFDARRSGRLGRDYRDDLGVSEVQADARSANRRVCQSDGGAVHHRFRIPVVTVASRISGLIGNSSNPDERNDHRDADGDVRGVFGDSLDGELLRGAGADDWRRGVHRLGDCGRDVAGFEDRAIWSAPRRRSSRSALVIGVLVSSFAIGGTLILMNDGLARYKPIQIALDINHLPTGVELQQNNYPHEGKTYVLVNAIGSGEIPDGKYLYDPSTRQIEIQWEQGIGSAKAAAPQARLMATVISGILNRRLPWRLVFLGVFLVIAVEMLGIRSLPFAVGTYISIGTTMAMFAGGLVRWLAEQAWRKNPSRRAR